MNVCRVFSYVVANTAEVMVILSYQIRKQHFLGFFTGQTRVPCVFEYT